MSAFVNISHNKEKEVYVDLSDVTGFHYFKKKDELVLFNSKGRLMYVVAKEWGIDVPDLLTKITAAGTPLQPLSPLGNKNEETACYVSPAAITYMTFSEAGKDGDLGVVAGVQGIGQLCYYHITPVQAEELITAVQAEKKMLAYTEGELTSRWASCSGVYIDPAAVTRIIDTVSINISFEKTGVLDIDVDASYVSKHQPVTPVDASIDKQDLTDAFQAALLQKKKNEEQAKLNFVTDVAAENGKLISLTYNNRAIYIRTEDVGYITTSYSKQQKKYSISVHAQETEGSRYTDPSFNVWFDTAVARDQAVQLLNKQLSAKQAPKKQASLGVG